MQNYTATIASPAKVKKALVEFKIKLDDDIEHNAVAFFNDVDKNPEFKDKLLSLKTGDALEFNGFEKFNDYQQVNEIVIKSTAIKELTYEEAMAMPTPGLLPPEERYMEVKKYTLPNGDVFWSDGIDAWGKNKVKAKLTYEFLDKYNRMWPNQKDKWLLPDWYSIEQAKRMKADPVAMALSKAFSTY